MLQSCISRSPEQVLPPCFSFSSTNLLLLELPPLQLLEQGLQVVHTLNWQSILGGDIGLQAQSGPKQGDDLGSPIPNDFLGSHLFIFQLQSPLQRVFPRDGNPLGTHSAQLGFSKFPQETGGFFTLALHLLFSQTQSPLQRIFP